MDEPAAVEAGSIPDRDLQGAGNERTATPQPLDGSPSICHARIRAESTRAIECLRRLSVVLHEQGPRVRPGQVRLLQTSPFGPDPTTMASYAIE